jgi:hypothetical protein
MVECEARHHPQLCLPEELQAKLNLPRIICLPGNAPKR